MEMKKVYISVGANLGNRIETIENAYKKINESCGRIVKKSSFYTTPPWGFQSDQEFINAVILIETELEMMELLHCLKSIEHEMGRVRRKKSDKYEDRLIDLDIIDYNQMVFESEHLALPHNKMHLRNFVLIPLLEIAPNWTHPVVCKSASYLLGFLDENERVKRFAN